MPLAMFASTDVTQLPVMADNELIPRDQRKEVDIRQYAPKVYNQGQLGSCNPQGIRKAMQIAFGINRVPVPELSAGYIYSMINGGRDQGSMPKDGIAFVTKTGACLLSTVPDTIYQRSKLPAAAHQEAPTYRVLEWMWTPTPDHQFSAVQKGFALLNAIMWHPSDMNLDANGCLPKRRTGNPGGHAFAGCGMRFVNGEWVLDHFNSWDYTYGVKGHFGIYESRLEEESRHQWGWYAIRQVTNIGGNIAPPINSPTQ